MQTIFITGCSSGFGLAAAQHFLGQGWRVVATMRSPHHSALPRHDRLQVLPLDVGDAASIAQAVQAAGPVDVLVNNAGIGTRGVLEGSAIATARELFEVNTLGTMAVTQAFLPQFRERAKGVVINITSALTLKAFPMLSVYTASKAAIDAFSASLALELQPLGIRVHVVMPGRAPDTRFGESARTRMATAMPPAYEPWAADVMRQAQAAGAQQAVTHPHDVVQAIWQAANDPSTPLRLPAGADAQALRAAAGG